jgi:hypothetical protein
MLTTVRADYSNGLIFSEVVSSTPFRSENEQLLSFITGAVAFQCIYWQGLLSSLIRDTLYSIYSSTTNTSINNNAGTQTQVYKKLVSFISQGLRPP